MTIGIGGAGCKIAARLDSEAVLVNVSETELGKVDGGGRRLLASLHAGRGQFKGSRKDPAIGLDAYLSVKRELSPPRQLRFQFHGAARNGICTGYARFKRGRAHSH